jgi:hypothetical protein
VACPGCSVTVSKRREGRILFGSQFEGLQPTVTWLHWARACVWTERHVDERERGNQIAGVRGTGAGTSPVTCLFFFFFRCWGPNSGPCHLPGKRSSNELNTQPRDLPLEATVLHLFALHCLLAKAPDSAYNFPPKVLWEPSRVRFPKATDLLTSDWAKPGALC